MRELILLFMELQIEPWTVNICYYCNNVSLYVYVVLKLDHIFPICRSIL
jgi:hypothetical protein